MPEIKNIEQYFKNHENNMMASVTYDTQEYSGVIIKIKTPITTDPFKTTTIKLFQKNQKINIDGANNIDEARHIYYWFNNILLNNNLVII